jgi:hypothetical protein
MQYRTKQQLLAAGRDLSFRILGGGGLLIGLVYGLKHPPEATPPPKCTTANCVGDVVSHSINSGVWAVLGPALICCLIGIAMAFFLSVTVLRPARRTAGATQSVSPQGRWMSARFSGRCSACRRQINRGDRIFHSRLPRRTYCADCGG